MQVLLAGQSNELGSYGPVQVSVVAALFCCTTV
jgi:hypothetical protein